VTADSTNRAQQILDARAELMALGPPTLMIDAIATIATNRVSMMWTQSRILSLMYELPTLLRWQWTELFPDDDHFVGYIDRLVSHVGGMAPRHTIEQWFQPIDQSMDTSLRGMSGMIGLRLGSTPFIDDNRRKHLEEAAAELVIEIASDEELDEEHRRYLLELASHIQGVLGRIRLFGGDSIEDLRAQFLLRMLRDYDLQPPRDGETLEDLSPTRRYATRIWNLMVAATVVVGLPVDAIELTGRLIELMP
jgi:hypothetical protein